MIQLSKMARGVAAMTVALFCGSLGLQNSFAAGGATDVIPGASKSGVKSGGVSAGGGGRRTTPIPAPTPTPAPATQPILTAPLTFSAAGPINGVVPLCTGSYRIDPYYPTLSRLTVYVQTSSVNEPDGTALYVTVVGTGGILYPFTSNAILIAGQAGACTLSAYITPGTVISGVVISNSAGTPILAGN